jgi:NUDIX domain
MELQHNVFDVWVFRRTPSGEIEYLVLHTSQEKADRWFNGGRFWQIPSNMTEGSEQIIPAIARLLRHFGLEPRAVWAAEHVYTIYNRRFDCMQIIAVYAAEARADHVELTPAEHDEYRWCTFDQALDLVTYRGLKDGLRSTREYITGRAADPPRELQLL